jgi:hypothetical protein
MWDFYKRYEATGERWVGEFREELGVIGWVTADTEDEVKRKAKAADDYKAAASGEQA